jgi:hypothetical protein
MCLFLSCKPLVTEGLMVYTETAKYSGHVGREVWGRPAPPGVFTPSVLPQRVCEPPDLRAARIGGYGLPVTA